MIETAVQTYPCPACGTSADLARGCPGCGRPPDRDAANVIRLDRVIAGLTDRELRLREEYAAAVAELRQVHALRQSLAARVTAASGVGAGAPAPALPPPAPPPAGPAAAGPAGPAREASTRTVQTLLFILGGLLLGTGAIVFTAVAWATFGVAGRAVILAVVTALVLATPLVARWRGLRGTAETFAAVGLLLLVLDGYAVWSVDLFGAGGVAPTTWAAMVCAVTALAAVGYARGTRLTGPAFGALVLMQPVLPLLVAEARPDTTGWAYAWVGLSAANVVVTWRLRGGGVVRAVLRVCGWVFTGAALATGASIALVDVLDAGAVTAALVAGGALLAAVAVLAGVALVSARAGWWTTTVVAAMLVIALVAGWAAALAWPGLALLSAAVSVAAVAGAGAAARWRWPRLRPGVVIGGLVATGAVGVELVAAALVHAAESVAAAWHHGDPTGLYDWQAPVALVLVAAALVAVLPVAWREVTAAGAALVALTVPPAFALAWWSAPVADLAVAAAFALVVVRTGRTRVAVAVTAIASVLVGHALLVGFATTAATAAVLGAAGVLGLATAAGVRPWRAPVPPVRLVIGRIALAAGLLAVPGAVAATVAATEVARVWPPRAALASTVLVLLAVALTRWAAPVYLSTAAAAAHVATPVAIIGGLMEEGPVEEGLVVGVYAGGALVLLAATAWLRAPVYRSLWLVARAPAALVVLVVAAPQLVTVLDGPFEWLGRIWTGAPDGTGVAVTVDWPDDPLAPVALVLLVVAAALSVGSLTRRLPAAVGTALLLAPAPLLVGLAQLGVPWPVVPAVSLLVGAAAVLIAALRASGAMAALAAGAGVLLAGAGLAGGLPERWSTLVGLGLAVVVAGVVGAAGRQVGARVAGWLAAAAFAVLLAVAAALAADLPLWGAALAVLVTAGAALAGGGLLRDRRRPEAAALECAAHAGALVALLLAVASSLGQAAVIVALWGVALGLRALWPGEAVTGRVARAVAGAGCELLAWWLLLAWGGVATVEAYTVPAAAVAAVAGWLVLRTRPDVGSWVALGPALAAGFLPSLYASLVDPVPLRRLLLGAVAVAVVIVGASQRWRAPVLGAGAVAALVAVWELALVWQLLDTWIPLTVAGLLLVALAATYERRRRDLARLRGSLAQMS